MNIQDTSTNHQNTSRPTRLAAKRASLPPIDFNRRRANRRLRTDRVIALLRNEAPHFFKVAEVVGKWIWIQFPTKQPRETASSLAELGFHWNNRRQAWQHPCGIFTEPTRRDPREKYRCYFPADLIPA